MTPVRVYQAALRHVSAEGCYSLLDDSEKKRASAMTHARAKAEFIKVRGILRLVLAEHLAKRPSGLAFAIGINGKPYLAGDDGLEFNVSHSGEVALIAVSRSPVGIDIEKADASIDHLSIAETVFSSEERVTLGKAPEAQRENVFLWLWTRKEAYLKATGSGFSSDLAQISSVSPDGRIVDHSQPPASPPWYAIDLPAPANFRAALVARTKDVDLSVTDISEDLPSFFRH